MWKFFIEIKEGDQRKVQCLRCLKKMPYHGNTTNPMKHLKTKHLFDLEQYLAEKKREETPPQIAMDDRMDVDMDACESTIPVASSSATSSTSSSSASSFKSKTSTSKLYQTSVKAMINKKAKNPYPLDSTRREALNKLLGEMICLDLQPLSIVDDLGFIRYTRALDPRYELPSRRTISRYVL